MTSSERATARLAAVASSTSGRLVDTWRPDSEEEFGSDWRRAETLAAIAVRSPSGIRPVCGWATQTAELTPSIEPKAAGLTASGP